MNPVSSKLTNKKKKDYLFVAVMLAIPIIHFIIFWGVVNFNSILLAFQRLDRTTGEMYITFKNFEALLELFETNELKDALVNTLLTAGFQIIFLLPWGFLLSYFLFKKIPLHGLWRLFLFLPSILPVIFLTGIFNNAITQYGPIGKIWEALFNSPIPDFFVDERYGKWGVLLYFFWTNFGGQFILFTGAMARIPTEIFEAAKVDGAKMGTELFKIVLPLCWPTFSMLLMLNMATVFTATGPILLLTRGAADTKTIAYWIFEQVSQPAPALYIPSALGVACTVILFPIITLVRKGLGKIYADVEF